MGNRSCAANFVQKSKTNAFVDKYFNNNMNEESITNTISPLDDRRLVFVNLGGLFQSWRHVPSVLMYTSLLLMPLKRKWIQHHSTHISDVQQMCEEYGCSDINKIKEFIHLLQWKDSQGLVLWILDELEEEALRGNRIESKKHPLIASFWIKLNAKLVSLYDHIEDSYYKPLTFNTTYWTNKEPRTFYSKYNTKPDTILTELYFVTMDDDAMREIIYQSNPKSLHPVVQYNRDKLNLYLDSKVVPLTTPLTPLIEEPQNQYANVNAVKVQRVSY